MAVPFLQELVRCEREQCRSQLEAEEEHHRSLLEQKQQAKRAKRVALVQDTLERVLDLVVKMCHYKKETDGWGSSLGNIYTYIHACIPL